MKQLFILFLPILLFSACLDDDRNEFIDGLRPVYGGLSNLNIETTAPERFEDLGNIVAYQQYLYIVERGRGVHIVDNTNPEIPETLGFIAIPSVEQITIDDDVLFANFGWNLLLIDITNPLNAQLLSAVADFFDESEIQNRPTNYSGYFECVDPTRGTVIGWEEANLFNPNCRS